MKIIGAKSAHKIMADRKMNYAQAVITSFCEELGTDKKTALAIARDSGVAWDIPAAPCGAVTSACMALGLAHKFTTENPRASAYPDTKRLTWVYFMPLLSMPD